ncbi:hypothetical protein SALBM217S_03917 [Streptomyces griseoloalbus]
MTSPLFRTKKVEQSIRDTEEPEHALKKSLSALDLTVFGVGVIIGTGIFVLTGTVAKDNAGPATAQRHHVVVPAAGSRRHADARHRLHTPGRALHHQHDLHGPRVTGHAPLRETVPQPLGGAPAVPPPAVGHRPHDVRGVDDHEQGTGLFHTVRVPRKPGQSPRGGGRTAGSRRPRGGPQCVR